MRILITGISGFVGSHLCRHLAEFHPEVETCGLHRWRSEPAAATSARSLELFEGDLLDAASIARVVRASRPDAVVHLAASSSVAGSWDTPAEMMHVNVLGTLHLLEAARHQHFTGPIVLACSAEAYGQVEPVDLPIREDLPFRPVSPYAVSKAAVDMLGHQYWRSHGLHTIRLRLFNHCGPGQPPRFVVSSLARQVAEIALGLRPPTVMTGDVSIRRDFLDVRDAAAAYWLAVRQGKAGAAYNVASGHAVSVKEVLARMLRLAGVDATIVPDPMRTRPADIAVLEGDAGLFRAATGWVPVRTLDQTLADTLDSWRATLQAGSAREGRLSP